MKTIYRYKLTKAINDIDLPRGAIIRSVDVCKDVQEDISIWAEIDTTAPTESRRFLIFGTGADMKEVEGFELNFIGTVKKCNQYAFHIYEVNNKTNF